MEALKRLREAGLIISVEPDLLDTFVEEIKVYQDRPPYPAMTKFSCNCVCLDFKNRLSDFSQPVARVREILPNAVIACTVSLKGPTLVDRMGQFGQAGGEIFTSLVGDEKGKTRKVVSLSYAYGPRDINSGMYKLYPNVGLNMLEAVTYWPQDHPGCEFVVCFRGQAQFADLVESLGMARLSAAGAVAVEISYRDVEEYVSSWRGEHRQKFALLAYLQQQFLQNRPPEE